MFLFIVCALFWLLYWSEKPNYEAIERHRWNCRQSVHHGRVKLPHGGIHRRR